MTAGWRKKTAKNLCLKFEPAAANGSSPGILDEIRVGTENEVGDVQNLATLIVDPDGKGLNDHWPENITGAFSWCDPPCTLQAQK